MKITQVEVFNVHPRESTGMRPVLVRIDTDEGIYGIGEAGMAYGIGGSAAAAMTAELAPLIIGEDPFRTEAIWHGFMQKSYWGKGGGTVYFSGVSALDTALWDIKAKALGVPLYQLLGGKTNGKLRSYASQLQFGWGKKKRVLLNDPNEYAEAALAAIEDGYTAVKVDLILVDEHGADTGHNRLGFINRDIIKLAERRLKAIRDAVGENVDIIVENHALTDVNGALQLAEAIEGYRIFFYEEATTPLNPELTLRIKEKTKIPLAGGERIYSRHGFRPFIEARSLDVIQPDAGNCGGVSEFRKIADAAAIYDIGVQAHVAGSGVADALSLHLEAAIPNFIIHEHHQKALLPEITELVTHPCLPKDGYFTPSELPGIGQDITDVVYKQSDRLVIE